MFRLLRLGCFISSLLMLIPVLLLVGGFLVMSDALGILPPPIAGPVESAERFVATQLVGGDLGQAGFSLRSIDIAPSGNGDGKFVLTVAAESQTALPTSPNGAALPAIRVVGSHLGQPFGLGNSISSIVFLLYGPGSTHAALAVAIKPADLAAWEAGTISDATFISRLTKVANPPPSGPALNPSPGPTTKATATPKPSLKPTTKPKPSPKHSPKPSPTAAP